MNRLLPLLVGWLYLPQAWSAASSESILRTILPTSVYNSYVLAVPDPSQRILYAILAVAVFGALLFWIITRLLRGSEEEQDDDLPLDLPTPGSYSPPPLHSLSPLGSLRRLRSHNRSLPACRRPRRSSRLFRVQRHVQRNLPKALLKILLKTPNR